MSNKSVIKEFLLDKLYYAPEQQALKGIQEIIKKERSNNNIDPDTDVAILYMGKTFYSEDNRSKLVRFMRVSKELQPYLHDLVVFRSEIIKESKMISAYLSSILSSHGQFAWFIPTSLHCHFNIHSIIPSIDPKEIELRDKYLPIMEERILTNLLLRG